MFYKKIVEMYFGSTLYGTNTPNSDTDIKGVFIPNMRDVFLQTVPSDISLGTKHNSFAKNTKEDVDHVLYSLNKYITLLVEGQVVALDMLFAPDNMIIETSHIWESLVNNRKHFLCKNTQAFVEYCRKQAAKYGIKGSRISILREVISAIDSLVRDQEKVKLTDCIDSLPRNNEYISVYVCPISKQPTYEVCNRKFQGHISIAYMRECLEKVLAGYGERAKLAEKNENIDWKAVSHAFRVCYEIKELLQTHKITFPLPQAEFLKEIKLGKMNYAQDDIGNKLCELMSEVDKAASESTLPESADVEYGNAFIINVYKSVMKDDDSRIGGM